MSDVNTLMKKLTYILSLSLFILFLIGCSTTKNIPEGSYLLDDFDIKNDTKNANADLEGFVRQHPNSSFPLLGKVRLKIYNMASDDTTRWKNRFLRKIGQAPVIYSPSQTIASARQLRMQASNQGYLNAEVDTTLNAKDKKIKVTYHLHGGDPYHIRNFTYDITDTTMARIMSRIPMKPLLSEGDMYDMAMLEEQRSVVNTIMRNVGYSTFSKEYVYFRADSTLNSHQVDLYMDIYPNRDSVPYPRYKINNVTVISGLNSFNSASNVRQNNNRWFFRNADTTHYHDINIVRGRNKFLRNSSVARNNYMKKGAYYSDYNLNRTYEAYTRLGAIRQVNISTRPSPEDSTRLLDATITLIPANAHWFRAGLDGTNSAGDIGVAPSVSYQHQNLFNGAEQLNIKLKGAYEFVNSDSKSYYEYGIETGLTFPQFLFPWLKKSWRELPSATTRFSIGLTNQNRSEYTRQFFNFGVNYGWNTYRNRLSHSLDLWDVNYVRMPSVSDEFRLEYLENPDNVLLRESYRDQLISRIAYSVTFVNGRRFNALYPTYSLRGAIEVSGSIPRLVSTISGAEKDENGQKKILGVAYAEYVKGSVDYARTFHFSTKHSLAYRVGLGLAYPYGNSKVLPFERRFFAGGANSVRGWSTRTLGPGSYQRPVDENGKKKTDFVNQAGDMSFILSIENRNKVSSLFEIAEFIDAGNIWTIKNNESFDQNQKNGLFKFNRFYKEIAVSYGVGLRLDLDFLLLRLDFGMKAYDPEKIQSERFVLFKPTLRRMAWHFGIGYPF